MEAVVEVNKMKCKICNNIETNSTTGLCDICLGQQSFGTCLCGKPVKEFTLEENKEFEKDIKKMQEDKQKCGCGEQTTFGNADVEIGGVCHRVGLPCYIIEKKQPTEMVGWEKEFDNDKEIQRMLYGETYSLNWSGNYLKSFITQTLQTEKAKWKEEMIEWCEKNKKDVYGLGGGYDNVIHLSKIINHLKDN